MKLKKAQKRVKELRNELFTREAEVFEIARDKAIKEGDSYLMALRKGNTAVVETWPERKKRFK